METSQVADLEFEPDISAPVEGLIHLGNIEEDFEYAGHTFGLRTLTVAEEIAAAKVIEPFRNTLKEPEAWAAAQVGLALTHVDGDEDFCPQAGPNKTAFAQARLNYVSTNWYWPTIDALFRFYAELLQKQIEIVRQVQDLPGRGLLTSWPLADSLNEPGISSEEIATEPQASPS